MKISAVVHGGVLSDARVIKEALSLRRAGHDVVIHGISPDGQRQQHVLPDSDVPVFLEPSTTVLAEEIWRRSVGHPLIHFGVVLPLQALLLALTCWVLWRLALTVHRRWDLALGFERVVAETVLLGVFGGVVFMRYRHLVARAVRSLISRIRERLRARRARRMGEVAVPAERFARLTRALAASIARQPAPDVFHLHDHVSLLLAAQLKARHGVPIVWDAHEIYQELADANPERSRHNAAIIAAGEPYIDRFITINESIARYYREAYPTLPPAQVVMNATVPQPTSVYDGCLHRAAGLPPTQRIVLFQGGFAAQRGLPQLVEAAAHFPPQWSLVLMGWGGLESALRAQAASRPRAEGPPAVVFLPAVPQQALTMWSAGAALGAIPYENTSLNHLYCTPNKLWEYPVAGVPVLCTDLVEMRAMLDAHHFGFLLPREFTAADIVAAVAALDDDALATARANCARFLATNNWSHWERNLLQVYESLRPAKVGSAPVPARELPQAAPAQTP